MDLSPLAPESALAVIGLRNILTGDVTYRATQRKEAAALPKTIKDHVLAFLKRPDFDRTAALPVVNFEKAGKLLVRGGTPENAEALMAAVKEPDLGAAVMALASKHIEYLNAHRPRRERQGLDGTEQLPPPGQAMARWNRLWLVSNDPELVLRDLREGCLSADMARCFRDLYPALYKSTTDAIQDGLVTMKAARKTWTLPIAKERALRVLMGLPIHNVQLAQQIQQAFAADAQAEAQKKGGAPARQKALSDASENASTPGQKPAAA
jgi:hypothetical protein